jgi:phosphoribosylcarboxyaminoimidazole (NCAIR) mutase
MRAGGALGKWAMRTLGNWDGIWRRFGRVVMPVAIPVAALRIGRCVQRGILMRA